MCFKHKTFIFLTCRGPRSQFPGWWWSRRSRIWPRTRAGWWWPRSAWPPAWSRGCCCPRHRAGILSESRKIFVKMFLVKEVWDTSSASRKSSLLTSVCFSWGNDRNDMIKSKKKTVHWEGGVRDRIRLATPWMSASHPCLYQMPWQEYLWSVSPRKIFPDLNIDST